jgi:hypothetical protein
MNPFRVTALMFPTGDNWMVQGLEFDVAAQGRTEPEAKLRFMGTLADQVMLDLHAMEEIPLHHLRPGPEEMFAAAIHAEASGPLLPVWLPKHIVWWRKDRLFIYVQFIKLQKEPPGGPRYVLAR